MRALFLDFSNQLNRKLMEVNFFGPVELTRAVLPSEYLKSWSEILTILSVLLITTHNHNSVFRSSSSYYCGTESQEAALNNSYRANILVVKLVYYVFALWFSHSGESTGNKQLSLLHRSDDCGKSACCSALKGITNQFRTSFAGSGICCQNNSGGNLG